MSTPNVPTVLVVDDDKEIRTLIGDYLRGAGLDVRTAADGRAMRRTLAGGTIDLLVLDLMLPGEDGLSLCRAVRSEVYCVVAASTQRQNQIKKRSATGSLVGCWMYAATT